MSDIANNIHIYFQSFRVVFESMGLLCLLFEMKPAEAVAALADAIGRPYVWPFLLVLR